MNMQRKAGNNRAGQGQQDNQKSHRVDVLLEISSIIACYESSGTPG
jgi:hypothetical protein